MGRRGFGPSVGFACAVVLALGLGACASSEATNGPGTQKGPAVDLAGFATTDLATAPEDFSAHGDLSSHADMSSPRDLAQPADMTTPQACGSITVFGTCLGNNFVSCDPDTNTLDVESCDVCILFEGIPSCL
jgi:hypothetical protein